MEIRQLTQNDSEAFFELIDITVNSLENPEFWLPIKDEVRTHFFDKSWTVLFGAFDGPALVGAVGLFLNESEYSESLSYLSRPYESPAKVDRLMIHPDYRGRGISDELMKALIDEARRLKLQNLLATIHTQNTAAKKVMEKIGMELMCFYRNRDGYLRNVFVMTIKEKKKGFFGLI
ncbi:MAG: GNAT family N-acetyltransferase [Acetatifactor sp.]|nr:GNAT family N-acetyltransferase [Acetatifactor sp.]MDE6700399.1 GNAT family N-acetyltransferase [Acetatifactor sp.]